LLLKRERFRIESLKRLVDNVLL
jgi:hypothetical protein